MKQLRQALLSLGIAIVMATMLSSCDSIDPTAQSFAISFRNDLGKTVELKLCADDQCESFDYSNTIQENEDYPENISDRNVLTRWLVSDASDHIIGCLPLRLNGKYKDVVVPISRVVPCPGSRPLRVAKGQGAARE